MDASSSVRKNSSYMDQFIQWMGDEQTSRVNKLAVLALTGLGYTLSMNFLIKRCVSSNILRAVCGLGAVCLAIFFTVWAMNRADRLSEAKFPKLVAKEVVKQKIEAIKKLIKDHWIEYKELSKIEPFPSDESKLYKCMNYGVMAATSKEGTELVLIRVSDRAFPAPNPLNKGVLMIYLGTQGTKDFGMRLAGGDQSSIKRFDSLETNNITIILHNIFAGSYPRFELDRS